MVTRRRKDHELHLTGDPVADQLLSTDPNALLIGMVLDQQVTMEKAFAGPAVIAERMGRFDVRAIAELPLTDFVALCSERPAIHRFPGSMGKRVHEVCDVLVRDWDADASSLWNSADTGQELRKLLVGLPGFGTAKATIMVALLGKRYGVQPYGWRTAAGDFGADGVYSSVADIVDGESLAKVRETKRAVKAEAKQQRS